ncbi:hypothetical protein A2276_06200 [candidate division WOR-1 bacterium RIFOXYA12_FULL_43_27]|uniref:Polysaccharide chain length determinant N-terminal domain-containing protein n=1 Tax=candidate division WOR-1 bacterium RIFOXYC2_FULL_46_14 TaxID=1802587 RepID=A0A1F4U566_UNCSA|nr:MAG: hypothetical protein A2276_06200 [candidate division WOR-1 bacterium RIFOXYA12_FULL_43_27]OGC20246.1 MAG: hypothetical protein A2292_04200 [candidate division WOR-1 bacterium RIFOXYB2_FULL_46_45]OGC32015.1 MAG: hypothetical protein A2232_07245 [candidate division WOR-1 bacterium RIFOXYA2_FULL_46_56]OGC40094.1 MAG: hypothetical protein A2438_02220 [candidate division WOR-1 bacterium RIFOXYC2_FULL_46_14]
MEDEINLMDYIRVIVKRKNLIIAFTIIGLFVGLIQGWRTPKMYKAEVTLLSMSSGMGGLASALSGLSFLGGGGGGSSDDVNIDIILKSRSLARSIAESSNLKRVIFAKKWDSQNNVWIGQEPTLDEFSSAIQSGLIGKKDNKITAQWSDPQVAADIANAYARGLTKFLNQKAMSVNLQILDEAVAPSRPYNKDTKKNVGMGGGVGLFIGAFLAFFLEYWGKISKCLPGGVNV